MNTSVFLFDKRKRVNHNKFTLISENARIFLIVVSLVFLTVTPCSACIGARAKGMGNAYMAVADDADTAYWNPAILNDIDPCVSFTTSQDSNSKYMDNYFRIMSIGDNYKWSFSAIIPTKYSNIGLISWEAFNSSDQENETGKAFIISVPLGQINHLSFGCWTGYFPDEKDNFQSSFTASYNINNFTILGRYDQSGNVYRLATSYKMKDLLVSYEYYYQPEAEPEMAVPNYYFEQRAGAELKIKMCSLRIGQTLETLAYKYKGYYISRYTINHLTYGIGLNFDKFDIDYSKDIYSQRTTLKYKF